VELRNARASLFARSTPFINSVDELIVQYEDVDEASVEIGQTIFENLKDDVVIDSFNRLLDFNSKYTLISYSNRSKLSIPDLIDLIKSKHDVLDIFEFDYKENSQANSTINSKYKINYSEKNKEYLILSKPK
jgi:hypothetical protein